MTVWTVGREQQTESPGTQQLSAEDVGWDRDGMRQGVLAVAERWITMEMDYVAMDWVQIHRRGQGWTRPKGVLMAVERWIVDK